MAYKYLLSTGKSTTKVEEYILDLVRLYLNINPGDIPGRPDFGINFTITNTMKDELKSEIRYMSKSLVETIKSRLSGVSLEIESISLIDEQRVRLVLQVDGKLAEEYYIDLYGREES